jgi:hypothetical protein
VVVDAALRMPIRIDTYSLYFAISNGQRLIDSRQYLPSFRPAFDLEVPGGDARFWALDVFKEFIHLD